MRLSRFQLYVRLTEEASMAKAPNRVYFIMAAKRLKGLADQGDRLALEELERRQRRRKNKRKKKKF